MRKILFTVLASTALLVAVPTMALAHNGHRHHHKRHHHVTVRHEKFVGHDHSGDVNPGNPGDATQPTAGTVTSFANNVLTITLTNGNTVSGEVTSDTEIKCEGAENMGDAEHGDRVSDHGPGGGDTGDTGDDNGDRGDDNDNDDNGTAMCAVAPGMAVAQAELTINGSGAVWNEVELVSTSTTPSQS
jgi:hypothetical protein